jgi:hypothetical protein
MIGYAPDGEFLSVSPDGKDWHIRLTRADKNRCDQFGLYHGRTITVDDVRRFLPNWDSLEWRSARLGLTRGVAAKDNEFQVWLLTTGDLANDQIVAEFGRLIGNAHDKDGDP